MKSEARNSRSERSHLLFTVHGSLLGWVALTVLLACATAGAGPRSAAADPKDPPAEKERELIRLLKSKAPPEEKAIPCKRLAIYGTQNAVPALAALLSDEALASWARITLEAIPGPA